MVFFPRKKLKIKMFKGYVVFVETMFFLVGELGIPEQKTHVHTCLYVIYMVNMLIDFWVLP